MNRYFHANNLLNLEGELAQKISRLWITWSESLFAFTKSIKTVPMFKNKYSSYSYKLVVTFYSHFACICASIFLVLIFPSTRPLARIWHHQQAVFFVENVIRLAYTINKNSICRLSKYSKKVDIAFDFLHSNNFDETTYLIIYGIDIVSHCWRRENSNVYHKIQKLYGISCGENGSNWKWSDRPNSLVDQKLIKLFGNI